MAPVLDQDTTKALTQTAQWQAYLESRRRMEQTRTDVERFVACGALNKILIELALRGWSFPVLSDTLIRV